MHVSSWLSAYPRSWGRSLKGRGQKATFSECFSCCLISLYMQNQRLALKYMCACCMGGGGAEHELAIGLHGRGGGGVGQSTN